MRGVSESVIPTEVRRRCESPWSWNCNSYMQHHLGARNRKQEALLTAEPSRQA